jgi:hypothetical protein
MSKAKNLKSQGPSWTEVILGAVLSVVLGAALAAVYLVLKPVTKAKELPKEPAAGMVYYLEGSLDTSKARQAITKQNSFAQGRSVTVTEDELNALVAPAPPPPAPKGKAPAAAPAPAAPPAAGVAFGPPNFRIRKGELQIAVPMHVGVAGLDLNVTVQARGGFARQGESFVFAPNEVYVGSCPAHRFPLMVGYVMKKMLAASAPPEGVTASWDKLSNVTLDGSTLQLTMP